MNSTTGQGDSSSQRSKRKREFKKEYSFKELWDTIKWINIYFIEITEGEKREKGTEILFREITTENFPNLKKEKTCRSKNPKSTK